MQRTTNANVFSQYRLGVKPDMTDVFSNHVSHHSQLTHSRDLERGNTPALGSKTLIYDQSRIVSPTNYYGTRFIKGNNVLYKINPAGLDGRNSTRGSGIAFTQTFKHQYPHNL